MEGRAYSYMCLFTTLLLQYTYGLHDYHFIEAVQKFYKVHTDRKVWQDAKQACEEEGATLFYAKNEAEADAVSAYVTKLHNNQEISARRFWVGLYANTDNHDHFYTIDGLSMDNVFNKWYRTVEPNNLAGNEYCVEMYLDGKLNDINCSERYSFICKKTMLSLVGPEGKQGIQGQKGEQGIQGQQGIQGLPGPKGERGYTGIQGNQGHPGATGPMGPQGKPGHKGEQGLQGQQGIQGYPGPKGTKGDTGPQGPPGPKGDIGPVGPRGAPGPVTFGAPGTPGASGMPGVCQVTCPVIIKVSKVYAEDIEPDLGSEELPSPTICKFKPATIQGPLPETYWVMEKEKFPVNCEKDTNRTCLILRHNDTKWINENKISVGKNTPTGMWLSESGFSLSRFNTITQSQLKFLKEQSLIVRQTVRVYFIRTTFESLQLQMLNANDIPIDQKPSAFTPMYYVIEKHDKDSVEVKGETWKYVDLVIVNEANRLPVVDFHVKHEGLGQEDAYITVQLRELCFF